MKILVLSSFAFSLVNFRGRLLSAMAAAGHDVLACAPDTDQDVEAVLGRMGIGYRRTPMGRTGANPFDSRCPLWSYVGPIRRVGTDIILAIPHKPINFSLLEH